MGEPRSESAERHTATSSDGDRLPPLRPWTCGSKVAVSCEKPGEWLIRAWGPAYSGANRLVQWITHHIGVLDLVGLEWWGYTYKGQPLYMRPSHDAFRSGLTIQRFVEPSDPTQTRMLNEGRMGPVYGPPTCLTIPESGVVQSAHPGGSDG